MERAEQDLVALRQTYNPALAERLRKSIHKQLERHPGHEGWTERMRELTTIRREAHQREVLAAIDADLHALQNTWDSNLAGQVRKTLDNYQVRGTIDSASWRERVDRLTAIRDAAQQQDEWRRCQLEEVCRQHAAALTDLRTRQMNGEDVLNEVESLAREITLYMREENRRGEGLLAEAMELLARARDPIRLQWQPMESAFSCRMQTGVIANTGYTEPDEFLDAAVGIAGNRIRDALRVSPVKVNAGLACLFISKKTAEPVRLYLWAKTFEVLPQDNVAALLRRKILDHIMARLDSFEEGESGLTLDEILHLKVNVNKYSVARCGVNTFVKLPKRVSDTGAVLNVINDDAKCFLWSVLAILHPFNTHQNRKSLYAPYAHELTWEESDFPMTKRRIRKFEDENDLRIFVFGWDEEDEVLYPWRKSRRKTGIIVDLFITPCGTEEDMFHFASIKNINRLLHCMGHRTSGRQHLCRNCMQYVGYRRAEDHERICWQNRPCALTLPKETELVFKNHRYKERVPVVCYGDFECMLQDINDKGEKEHVPIAAGLYVHCEDYVGIESEYISWSGSNCVKMFLQQLLVVSQEMVREFARNEPMINVPPDINDARDCWICGQPFMFGEQPVLDHSHWTGKFRGAAHADCNLNYSEPRVIPVFLHNLSGYDGHILMRELLADNYGYIDVLPLNKEKYISFSIFDWRTKIRIRFVDSYRFMAASLATLAKVLPNEKKHVLRQELGDDISIANKGHFPYEWLKDADCLKQTTFPTKDDFFNQFLDQPISDEDYADAKSVWDCFKTRDPAWTMHEYLMLYLRVDVCLLADIYEAFRQQCQNTYDLDPAHYLTAPSLAMDAALKHSGIRLELLQDMDMVQFFETGIRGGVAQVSRRYAKANIPETPDFDSNAPESCIGYVDANNLYGWAMSQALPYSHFEWMPAERWHLIGSEGPEIGYHVEVDLEYPEHLFDNHSDLPLAPEHRIPPPATFGKKLMCTLYPKDHYVVYFKTLALYKSLGLKMTKTHRVLRYYEKPWLASYIAKNTAQRQLTTSKFEKDFYKLMNNAVFGKMIENVRKRRRVKIPRKWGGRNGAGALIASPLYHSQQIIHENAVIIELYKSKVCMDKPIYGGAVILDMAKFLMYDFHYYFMRARVPAAELLYTDTDSLMYFIPGKACFEDVIRMQPSLFDTSSYPQNHPLFSRENEMVIGKMKNEVPGKQISAFVGLRAKMYSFCILGEEAEKKRAKGIRGPALRKLNFASYLKCLHDNSQERIEQFVFRSTGHRIYTRRERKIGLSAKDDKRYLCTDDVTRSLPWSPVTLQMYEEQQQQQEQVE